MIKILQITIILLINMVLTGCSSDLSQNQISVDSILKPGATVNKNQNHKPATKTGSQAIANSTQQKNTTNSDNKEEKVIVSINNFGRTNPFSPFMEKSLVANNMSQYGLPQLSNIPPPPTYTPDPQIEKLLEIKVSGILYDPPESSAIITVDEEDYLVHKGDTLFDYRIKDIIADKVIIKLASNIYKVGIGEIIGEAVNIDPVKRKARGFADSQKVSSIPEVRLVTPTYISSFN